MPLQFHAMLEVSVGFWGQDREVSLPPLVSISLRGSLGSDLCPLVRPVGLGAVISEGGGFPHPLAYPSMPAAALPLPWPLSLMNVVSSTLRSQATGRFKKISTDLEILIS